MIMIYLYILFILYNIISSKSLCKHLLISPLSRLVSNVNEAFDKKGVSSRAIRV